MSAILDNLAQKASLAFATPPRVMIVEDDDDLAYSLSICLESAYAVHVTRTAQETLEEFELERPDVMLVDFQLPDLDGIRLVSEIRRRFGGYIPAVMMSAYHERRQAALTGGFASFIGKPFADLDLVWAIENALRRP